MADREVVHEFTLRVRTYGDPHRTRAHVARTLGRAAHHAFGDRVTIDGVRFDPLADDGEHDGHDTPVVLDGG